MFDDQLRGVKEGIFTFVAKLGFGRLPPLGLSLIGLVFGVLTAVALSQRLYVIGFVFWFFNRVFDGLDGTVARLSGKQSDFGGYIDILVDFVTYAIIPIGLVWGRPLPEAARSLIFLLATYYVNAASWMYLSAIIEKRSLSRADDMTTVNMPNGLIGGAATIFFYTLFIVFPDYLALLFTVMGLLIAVTILQRIMWANHNLS